MPRRKGPRAARVELLAQAGELAELMRRCGGRSAMVRVFVDEGGRVVAACNLYGPKGYGTMTAASPIVEFREELSATARNRRDARPHDKED